MIFLLDPYDAVLNLNQKDDSKLLKDGSEGLKEKDKFDGKRGNYINFTKLMKVMLNLIRAMETLDIPVEWTGEVKQPTKLSNLFKDKKITKQQVKRYSDLVWGDTDHAGTSQLFQTFDAEPLNDAELTAARYTRKIKSMIGRLKTWNIVTSEYQLKILPNEDDFKRKGKFYLPSI